MLVYAQIQGTGTESEIAIAVNGRKLCAVQKQRYFFALRASMLATGASEPVADRKSAAQLDEDQRTISLRAISLLRRMRQK